MKRLLIFVMAIVAAASIYDYMRTPGEHNAFLVLGGVVLALILIGKAIG